MRRRRTPATRLIVRSSSGSIRAWPATTKPRTRAAYAAGARPRARAAGRRARVVRVDGRLRRRADGRRTCRRPGGRARSRRRSTSSAPDYFETLGLPRAARPRVHRARRSSTERVRQAPSSMRGWPRSCSAMPIRSAVRCRSASREGDDRRGPTPSSASRRAAPRSFESPPEPHIYVAYGARFSTMMTMHVRTAPGVPDDAPCSPPSAASCRRSIRSCRCSGRGR